MYSCKIKNKKTLWSVQFAVEDEGGGGEMLVSGFYASVTTRHIAICTVSIHVLHMYT